MGTRRLIAGVVLLAALLLAGCGDNRSAATREMDTKFQKVDFEMANLETVNSEYNNRDFARETQRYIAVVREYAGQLGRAEARRRLLEKGDELSSYCLPCTATLESEALKY